MLEISAWRRAWAATSLALSCGIQSKQMTSGVKGSEVTRQKRFVPLRGLCLMFNFVFRDLAS
jgi:hypothetical protein